MISFPSMFRKFFAFSNSTRRLYSTTHKVALDPALQDDFVQEKYKPRRHPGINKLKTVELPPNIQKSIRLVLEDASYKLFYDDSVKLDNYLRSRLPPPEQKEIDAKAKALHNNIARAHKVSDITNVELEKRVQAENVKIFNILKSKVYRWANIDYNRATSIQYLMARSAAEYAVLCRIFEEINRAMPDYKPRSFFDFGSGVGTGTWAVNNFWKNHIFEYFSVDTSRDMQDIARIILCGGQENAELPLKGFFQKQFLPASATLKYAIVLSAYSLFEMPSRKERLETIQKLWNKTEDFLIVVEQGTNAGFKLVNEVREFILEFRKKQKGYVFAPCPNDNVCPRYLENETPCNFLMKYSPPRFLAKGNVEMRSELFSYVILRKGIRPSDDKQWPRIVRPPIVRSRHTICRMCTARGELQEVIFTKSKHDQHTYRCARSGCWGDLLPVKLESNTEKQNSHILTETNTEVSSVSKSRDNTDELLLPS